MNDGSATSQQPVAPTVMSTQQVGKYKVEVINEKCIGAASCVAIAPGTFVLNEQNIAEVISQNGDPDDMKLLGAQSCPTAAIRVIDTETGQQVWPIE
jgi:ferredoxin